MALHEIEAGVSVNHVSHKFHIKRKTPHRHRDGNVSTLDKVVHCSFKTEFNTTTEEALCLQIKQMLKPLMFGLTVMDVQQFMYDLAEDLGSPHQFDHNKRPVGKGWI